MIRRLALLLVLVNCIPVADSQISGGDVTGGFTTSVTPPITAGQCLVANSNLVFTNSSSCGTAGAVSFSGVTTGTNNNTLTVGSGGSLTTSGTGTVTATGLSSNAQLPSGIIAPLYYATTYGSCTWNSTNDTGPCVNLAIAAAAAAGGGTVILPCGTFGLATQLLQQTSGVHIQGCGIGNVADTYQPNQALSVTEFWWIGSSTANPMLLVQTPNSTTTTLYSVDVVGVTFDCKSLAAICAEFNGVSFSQFVVGASNSTQTNIVFTTPSYLEALGNQSNDIWLYSRVTTGTAVGILFDSVAGAATNTSYNRMHMLYARYNNGDGIVFGGSDNNLVYDLRTIGVGSAAGRPAVCANTAFVPSNGVAVGGNCYSTRFLHTGSALDVLGFNTNATFTSGGSNTGTAALAPLTLTTNAASSVLTYQIYFSSTTGVSQYESISCGGPGSGLFSNSPIVSVAPTLINMAFPFKSTVPSGTNCTFSWSINPSAVSGTYTITAASSTTFNITAPAGGHSQTGVAYSGGAVAFIDMYIPLSGTPATGDTFTVVVPSPANKIVVENVDAANSIAAPTFEYGSSGSYTTSGQSLPFLWNESIAFNGGGNATNSATTNSALSVNTANGPGAVSIGGTGNFATSSFSTTIGGNSLNATGFASVALNSGTTASALDSMAVGSSTTASGSYGFTAGLYSADRGNYGRSCYADGRFAATGDAQSCLEVMRGTGASTSAIRLTADGAAAGSANCVNIPNNTAYELTVDFVALDHTTVTKNASWNLVTGLLTRGANAASTTVTVSSLTIPTYSSGTLTGEVLAITADTTNGCLNISYTPPTGNTDTYNTVARVQTVEVQ